jgi:hypothetical protein
MIGKVFAGGLGSVRRSLHRLRGSEVGLGVKLPSEDSATEVLAIDKRRETLRQLVQRHPGLESQCFPPGPSGSKVSGNGGKSGIFFVILYPQSQ